MNDNNNDDMLKYVISDGVQFLKSLASYYGPEKGMELWEEMGKLIGKEIKGKIFFAMITGSIGGCIYFKLENADYVATIKLVREYGNLGLKEAKDLVDQSKIKETKLEVRNGKIIECIRDLRSLGCLSR